MLHTDVMTECIMVTAGRNKTDYKKNAQVPQWKPFCFLREQKELNTQKSETANQTAKEGLHDQTEDNRALDHLRLTDT